MSDDPENFRCNACGDCCKKIDGDKAVLLNDDDVSRIASELKTDALAFLKQYCSVIDVSGGNINSQVYRLNASFQGSCPFLAQDNSCDIHAFKPHQCRWTPYLFMYDADAFQYDCMKGIKVSPTWTSAERDTTFLAGIGRKYT